MLFSRQNSSSNAKEAAELKKQIEAGMKSNGTNSGNDNSCTPSTTSAASSQDNEAKEKKRVLAFDYETSSSDKSRSNGDSNEIVEKAAKSLSSSLRKLQAAKKNKRRGLFSNKRTIFNFVVFMIPTFLSMWYAAAILFPPGARAKYDLLLWDDGYLIIGDDGQFTLCPRPSICAEGLMQLIAIAIARLSAFASYVFIGACFFTKMHFLNHFFASTYLRKFIPFASLHHIHKKSSKILGMLILMHTISHYIRYIARNDIDQLTTKVHVSGLIGFVSLLTMIIAMSPFFKARGLCKFETRFNLHWIGFIIFGLALCIHHWRARLIAMVFIILWSLDYLYGLIFATYNLEVVEFLPLPKKKGVQMLWHNQGGFRPRSGEYVLIQLPWLSKGGDEWHPFSVYLKESTEKGYKSVHNISSLSLLDRSSSTYPHYMDEEAASLLSLTDFMRSTLDDEFEQRDPFNSSIIREEARESIHNQYDTTQVFITPVGDWSNNLMQELEDQQQKRACWVRGPYTSPYSVASNFSHLVLTATGIGITPALGVLGQYPGLSRTKILVWSVRDKSMLKFFAPLITDSHLAVVYYTGSEKLSNKEVIKICSHGNIFLQQSRPKDGFSGTVESVVIEFENHINLSAAETLREIQMVRKAAWCVLYCGGSKGIKNELKEFSKRNGVGFEAELFNW